MQLGMVGLGRMGGNMARRLLRGGHECVVFNRHPEKTYELQHEGAVAAFTLSSLAAHLHRPRIVWLMVSVDAVDEILVQLAPLLEKDDIVVDGGNSYYRDDIRRAERLRMQGVHYLDVGTSGGIAGRERGYSLMIGGEEKIVQYLAPIFTALSSGVASAVRTGSGTAEPSTAEHGYLHCGPHGAGHFVKMVHNGIEYGVMAAYAEGMNILHHAQPPFKFSLPDIAEVWRRGSVLSSWLLDLSAEALVQDAELKKYSSQVADSGEGRWAVQAAVELSVPLPVISAALFSRFDSRGNADYASRLLSAMRKKFGGHDEQPSHDEPE